MGVGVIGGLKAKSVILIKSCDGIWLRVVILKVLC